MGFTSLSFDVYILAHNWDFVNPFFRVFEKNFSFDIRAQMGVDDLPYTHKQRLA